MEEFLLVRVFLLRAFIFSDKDSSISKLWEKANTEKLKMEQSLKVRVLLNFLISSVEELQLLQAKEKLLLLQKKLKEQKELLFQMMLRQRDLKKSVENLQVKSQQSSKPLSMLWKRDNILILAFG